MYLMLDSTYSRSDTMADILRMALRAMRLKLISHIKQHEAEAERMLTIILA